MKRILISLLSAFIFTSTVTAQQKDSLFVPLLIKFQSHCCGVPSEQPLKKYISRFKKQQKIKTITAQQIGPMGKEGEYFLAFELKNLSRKKKLLFIKNIQTVVTKMTDTGNAVAETNTWILRSELPGRATWESRKF